MRYGSIAQGTGLRAIELLAISGVAKLAPLLRYRFRVWAARNKFRYSGAAILMTTFDLQFDPIAWQQLELLARLTPGERMRASVMAHEFATTLLRGTLRRRFPDLSLAELNMMVLRHCTEVRGMEEDTFDER